VYLVHKRPGASIAFLSVDTVCSFAGIKGRLRRTLTENMYLQDGMGVIPLRFSKRVYKQE
jgi:hypothetical protein